MIGLDGFSVKKRVFDTTASDLEEETLSFTTAIF
jgi:hypothetical protein